jgi:hypothetical protein
MLQIISYLAGRSAIALIFVCGIPTMSTAHPRLAERCPNGLATVRLRVAAQRFDFAGTLKLAKATVNRHDSSCRLVQVLIATDERVLQSMTAIMSGHVDSSQAWVETLREIPSRRVAQAVWFDGLLAFRYRNKAVIRELKVRAAPGSVSPSQIYHILHDVKSVSFYVVDSEPTASRAEAIATELARAFPGLLVYVMVRQNSWFERNPCLPTVEVTAALWKQGWRLRAPSPSLGERRGSCGKGSADSSGTAALLRWTPQP